MANLISPFVINEVVPKEQPQVPAVQNQPEPDIGFSVLSMLENHTGDYGMPISDSSVGGAAKKRGRPRKDQSESVINIDVNGNMVPNNANGGMDYHAAYRETDAILKYAIGQTDNLINAITEDISEIRKSKAMQKKYGYITDLSETMSSLISTKISAARELNNAITHANDMEYKMQKELKVLEANKNDDNKTIMDMYNAFMSVPVGTYKQALGPSIQEMTLPGGTNLNAISIETSNSNGANDPGYQSYLNNMTPEQNRMRYENNPNIQEVVVYNQMTGAKSFDVIDVTTGQSVPNVARSADFLLDDTRPDLAHGVARNSNIEKTWKLIVVGEKGSIFDY